MDVLSNIQEELNYIDDRIQEIEMQEPRAAIAIRRARLHLLFALNDIEDAQLMEARTIADIQLGRC